MNRIITLDSPYGEITANIQYTDEQGTSNIDNESYLYPVITNIQTYLDTTDITNDGEHHGNIRQWINNNEHKILNEL